MPVKNSYSPSERFTLKGSAWAFWLIHLIPLLAIFTSITRFDVLLLVLLYFTRMFFITGGMHRYFAHRSYKLNRFWQFWMGVGGDIRWTERPVVVGIPSPQSSPIFRHCQGSTLLSEGLPLVPPRLVSLQEVP